MEGDQLLGTDIRSVKIMISSTVADLKDYRDEAARIIRRLAEDKAKSIHLVEISMEREVLTGQREWSVDISKHWVEESDWIILIVGFHYGTVSDQPEALGLSMTEWEYRHAVATGGKKIFVFMADDPTGSAKPPGQASPGHGLKGWLDRTDKDKMLQFRRTLQSRHLRMFPDLAAFGKDLEATLRNQIDELLKPPVGALAELVAAVGDAITAFTDEVELIVDCKGIHDGLHELLQEIIRPLHDAVLPKWEEEGDLKPATSGEFIRRVMKLAKQEGVLETRLKKLGAPCNGHDSDLHGLVNRVLKCAGELHPRDEPVSGRRTFAELFDGLVEAVEAAFREADSRMGRELEDLRTRRDQLLERVENARQQRPLTPAEDRQLGLWLHGTGKMVQALRASLMTHHDWQKIHEAIEEVEALRGTTRLRSKLGAFCEDKVGRLKAMARSELERIGAKGQMARQAAGEAGTDHFEALHAGLTRLEKSRNLEDFDAIRKAFDDSFYKVDKRTLAQVEESRDRVKDWIKLRDELLRAHSVQPSPTTEAGRAA